MSNCLKCNHCGQIGVEALNEPGPEDKWRAFIGVKGWAYIGKIRKTGSYYPSDEFWHLCPTCTGYLEVFMGERGADNPKESHYVFRALGLVGTPEPRQPFENNGGY